MSIEFLKRALLFVVFVLAQALVLGRVHLFHCATPLLYVYFVTMFPRNYPKWGILLWSFLLGLMLDTFSNTPGLAAASLTVIAAIQPYYFELFVPRDSVDDLKPALSTLGPLKYSYYIIIMVLLYCLIFYSLELFTYFNWVQWAFCVGGSAAITLMLIFTFEIAKLNR
jgi:rod shape-determining protein MreD